VVHGAPQELELVGYASCVVIQTFGTHGEELKERFTVKLAFWVSPVMYYVLQSAQIFRSESEQNAIRTESYWPAAHIWMNGWLRVRRECVLFGLRQAKLSRLQMMLQCRAVRS